MRSKLALVLLLSLVLKLALVVAVRDMECTGDQCSFLWAARSVLAGEGFTYNSDDWDDGHTPPLYVLFLSACLGVGGGALSAVRIAQALLSTGTALFAFYLARRWAGPRAALLAAAFAAFLPEFLAYFQWAFAENLFVFELGALTLLILRMHERRRLRDALWVGIALGLTCLTRTMMVFFVVPLAVWLLATVSAPRRRAWLLMAVVAVAQFAVIAPWTIHNAQRFDRFLLLATNAGNVIHRNLNWSPPENYDYKSQRLTRWKPDARLRPRCTDENPVDRYRCEKAGGRQFVLDNPGRTLRYALIKVRALWNPSSFFVRYLCMGVYGNIDKAPLIALTWLSTATMIVAILLGTIGASGGPAGPVRSLFIVYFLYWHAIYGMAFGMSRYRMPLMLFFVVAAAVAAADPRAMLHRLQARRRVWPALALWGVLLAASWALYLPILARVP